MATATDSPTLATPANMRRFEDNQSPNVYVRVLAYSPTTGEEYSATSGDYWNLPDNEPLRDRNGDAMLLVVPVSGFVDALQSSRDMRENGPRP